MTALGADSAPRSPADIDLVQVYAALRRRWPALLLIPLLVGGLTFALARRQAPVFEASTSLMSSMPDSSNAIVSGASLTASQLPQGAVDEVIHSRGTVTRIDELLSDSDLSPATVETIRSDLDNELAMERFKRITVRSKLDTNQRGVYELRASAGTPDAAQLLASSAAQALLEWDLRRAQEGVTRARRTLQQQLDNINQRLAATTAGSVEHQSLIAARGQLLLNLSQTAAFEEGARGNLTLLAEANAPRVPVYPRPVRTAGLAALVALLLTAAAILIGDALRRRIQHAGDLLAVGVPVLGELPRLRRIKRNEVVGAARSGELYESAGFVRVNLSMAAGERGSIIAVSSSRPGEGKSSVTAATASSLSVAGKRVLIIDLDLHRPTQHEFWQVMGRPSVALPGSHDSRQTTVVQALENPYAASVVDLGGGVHLLPAGETGRRAASLLSAEGFGQILREWATAYDVVLIDTPPLLALSDGYVIARNADGLVLVVESQETSVPEVEQVLRAAQSSGAPVIGAVLNKVRRGGQSYFYSAYRYTRAT
ncbi:non-specific protein-tyrosine kinase [Deinococcus metalli]|uniref:Non-specific protein-tyrosine kinase n=1 Tax=Deinococcus metalli TaxID=1141878 RepID=A0A7W8KED8_9DEIO|nr:P-loop NTPase [Deinococcus metalli]MBB5376644.1 non-specific protein-tyrosine kinase [Deinococcus metalli]